MKVPFQRKKVNFVRLTVEQAVEITDRFDQDGVCHVHLSGGKDVIYLTVFRENGYAYSSHKYPDPNKIA